MQLNIELNVSPRHVFFALVGTSIFFLIFDAIVYSFSQSLPRQFRELVDITKESNLPTWFSSTQLLFVGLCAYFVGNFKRRQGEQKKALGWFVIAVFFAYMGIDDTSQLHERVSTVIAEVVNQSSADILLINAIKRFPSYYWLIILLPIFGGFGLFMLIFLSHEFELKRATQLFRGGILFYVVAVGLDYFDGIYGSYDVVVAHTPLTLDGARHLVRAAEEFVEMVGASFILVAFLQHWHAIQESLRLQPPDKHSRLSPLRRKCD